MPPRARANLVFSDFNRYFFMATVILCFGLFAWVISPFFYVLIYASLIAVVFWPLHQLFLRWLGGRKSIAAFLSTLFVSLIVLGPLTVFSIFLVQEALDALFLLQRNLQVVDFGSWDGRKLADLPLIGSFLSQQLSDVGLSEFVKNVQLDVYSVVQQMGETLSSFIVNSSGSILQTLGKSLLDFFILILSTFFLFRDGVDVVAFFKKISPLPPAYENGIEAKLKEAIHGIVFGNFGTALAQGLVGGVGLAIAGVENVLFWTTLMSFSSLLPYFGGALIWAPFAFSMILQGDSWGIFLLIWGTFLVSSVDNLVRPFLIGGSMDIHPLATFLVVLGGFLVFGASGIILGPLVLSLAVSVLHIYQLEYAEVLKEG